MCKYKQNRVLLFLSFSNLTNWVLFNACNPCLQTISALYSINKNILKRLFYICAKRHFLKIRKWVFYQGHFQVKYLCKENDVWYLVVMKVPGPCLRYCSPWTFYLTNYAQVKLCSHFSWRKWPQYSTHITDIYVRKTNDSQTSQTAK